MAISSKLIVNVDSQAIPRPTESESAFLQEHQVILTQ